MATAPRRRRSTNPALVRDNWPDVQRAMRELVAKEVLVGFPEDSTDRKPDPAAAAGAQPTNAQLAYIHDNGEPANNIPARPFMRPAVENSRDRAASVLGNTARAAVRRGVNALSTVDRGLHSVGLIVQAAIKARINEGIPPPLSERTLRDRASRGRAGAAWELAWRDAGAPAGTEISKPLIDTGQLRNAANYVIRNRRARRP